MSQSGRQFVNYAFYKLSADWRRLPREQRDAMKKEFCDVAEKWSDEMLVRSYSLVGTRGDVDFALWRVTEDVAKLHECSAALNQTELGRYLAMPHHYLSTTKRSIYVTHHVHEGQEGA